VLETFNERTLHRERRARDLFKSSMDAVDEEEIILVRKQLDAIGAPHHCVLEDVAHEHCNLAGVRDGKNVEIDR